MYALVSARNCTNLQMDMSFEDFLGSGHVARHAKVAMCSPDDLILDYLPDFDPSEPDEIREAFSEACVQAADGAVDKVNLDDTDLLYVREHFLHDRPFRLVGSDLPEAA